MGLSEVLAEPVSEGRDVLLRSPKIEKLEVSDGPKREPSAFFAGSFIRWLEAAMLP